MVCYLVFSEINEHDAQPFSRDIRLRDHNFHTVSPITLSIKVVRQKTKIGSLFGRRPSSEPMLGASEA